MSDIPSIDDYPHVADVTTRWNDNDVYGHVNNVIFYSYFDSVANAYLIGEGSLDIHGSDIIGLVVESGCKYHAPIEYPAKLRIGLRVDRLGNSSVTYGLGVFTDVVDDAVAHGHFTHVFVDRDTRRPTPIPGGLRDALERLVVA